MKTLLVIEDGDEYAEFARLFLSRQFEILHAKSAREALAHLRARPVAGLLIDLRFDRATQEDLTGDIDEIAARLFAGDRERALRHVQDQQGTMILAVVRAAGFSQPALFVHAFPPRRLDNLRKLYGNVHALPSFDAAEFSRVFEGLA